MIFKSLLEQDVRLNCSEIGENRAEAESSLFKKFTDKFGETAFSFRSIMSQKLLLLLLQISFITCNFRMYLSEEGDDGVVNRVIG